MDVVYVQPAPTAPVVSGGISTGTWVAIAVVIVVIIIIVFVVIFLMSTRSVSDFTISSSPAALTIARGNSGTVSITTTAIGPSAPLTLSATTVTSGPILTLNT